MSHRLQKALRLGVADWNRQSLGLRLEAGTQQENRKSDWIAEIEEKLEAVSLALENDLLNPEFLCPNSAY
jgi:hypothetical protein